MSNVMFLPYFYPFLPEDLPYIVLTIEIVQKFKFRVLEEATKCALPVLFYSVILQVISIKSVQQTSCLELA